MTWELSDPPMPLVSQSLTSHIQIGRIEVAAKRLDLSIPHTEHIAYRHGSGLAFGSGEVEVELHRYSIARFGIANNLAIEIHASTQHGRILLSHRIGSFA